MKLQGVFKPYFIFIMFFFFTIDSGFSVLAQARSAEAAKAEGIWAGVSNKTSALVDEGVKKCKAVAEEVANYSKQVLGPLADPLWSCMKEVFKGAWSSTGGAVVDAYEGTGKAIGTAAGCVSEPSYCARNVAKKVMNTASFMTEMISKVKSYFSNLSAEQVRDLLCNVLGSLGAPLLLSIATGGAASGLLGANVARIFSLLQKLGNIGPINAVLRTFNLPFEIMMKMTDATVDRVAAILKKNLGNGPKLREKLMTCN
jgi:hypothetical protein